MHVHPVKNIFCPTAALSLFPSLPHFQCIRKCEWNVCVCAFFMILLFQKGDHLKLLSRPNVICTNCQRHLMSAIICYDMVLWDNRYSFCFSLPLVSLRLVSSPTMHSNFFTHFPFVKLRNSISTGHPAISKSVSYKFRKLQRPTINRNVYNKNHKIVPMVRWVLLQNAMKSLCVLSISNQNQYLTT